MGRNQGCFSVAKCCFISRASSPFSASKASKTKTGGSKARKVREVPTALPVPRCWTWHCSVGWHLVVLLCCVFPPGRCPGAGHGVFFSGERAIIYNEWFWCLLGECVCMCAIRAGLGEPEPGLQGQSCPQCPVDRDGDGWLPCEQICATGSLPALLAPAAVADGRQVPAPVPEFRAAAVGRFCTLGVPAVAMEMPTLCLNGKSCLWPWIRGSGQTPGKGQQATAARQAMLLLRSTSASAAVPPAHQEPP